MSDQTALQPFRSHLTAMAAGLVVLALALLVLMAGLAIVGEGEGRNVIQFGGGDAGEFSLAEGDTRLEAVWAGEFAFAADGRGFERIDGRLEITETQDGVAERAVFKGDDDLESTTYEVDGAARPAEPGAFDLLARFVRTSGLEADARIEALLAAGGAEAALDEIARLPGAYSKRVYAVALAEGGPLSEEALAALIAAAGDLPKDYDRRQVIEALADAQSMSAPNVAALAAAAAALEDPREARLAIAAIAEHAPDTEDARAPLRAAAETIDDERERERALKAVDQED